MTGAKNNPCIPRAFPVKECVLLVQFLSKNSFTARGLVMLGMGSTFLSSHKNPHTGHSISITYILCYTYSYSCITISITYYIHINTNGALVKLSVILINGLSLSLLF